MKYRVLFKKSAAKEFAKLNAILQKKILEALSLLSVNPFTEFLPIKKLKNERKYYRLRIQDYRIVYEVLQNELIVTVIKIGHRREVYKNLH